MKKVKLAAEQCQLQSQSHIELMQALPDPCVISKWTAEVEVWERDHSCTNLYYVTFKDVFGGRCQVGNSTGGAGEYSEGRPGAGRVDKPQWLFSSGLLHQGRTVSSLFR